VSIAPDRHAARRCAARAGAGSKPSGVGVCMPPGWSGIGRSWLKGPSASPSECQTRLGRREIVTHHGSPLPVADDLLADGATAMPRDDASPAEPCWCSRRLTRVCSSELTP
jgi:hypothetical protein